jgi:hypothetical protein
MRRLLLLACTLVISLSAHAAPPSRDSVEKLLSVIDMKKTYDATFVSMKTSMDQAFASMPQVQAMTPEQHQRFDIAMDRVFALMRDEMDWDKLKPEFAQLYTETFTQEEVDGLLEFYRSPAGRAMIEKMPLLLSKSMQMTQTRIQKLMPRILQEPAKAP